MSQTVRFLRGFLLVLLREFSQTIPKPTNSSSRWQGQKKASLITLKKAAMCGNTEKLVQGPELPVLYPIQGLRVIASEGTLGCVAENDKASEIQRAWGK